MSTFKDFESELYSVTNQSFNETALSLFHFQAESNTIYKSFIQNLGLDPGQVQTVGDIPFLPISFFKNHAIKSGEWDAQTVFASSGTTGMTTSSHAIKDLEFYLSHAEKNFVRFFGPLSDYHFLALLPSYLERKNSSLVAMIDHFIKRSESPYSGFYLHNTMKLVEDIERLRSDPRKTILWGVTFALLDLAETHKPDLGHCLVFETGGMKGRRKELTRDELHHVLRTELGVANVYSEYGMTEMLSQAYSNGGLFQCPPWLKVLGREVTDPFQKGLLGEICGINVVDLANRHSIAFIETEDLGKVYPDGSFEVLGRFDNSDLRGCNLLGE